jgi:hypothetical protein
MQLLHSFNGLKYAEGMVRSLNADFCDKRTGKEMAKGTTVLLLWFFSFGSSPLVLLLSCYYRSLANHGDDR